MNAFPFFVPENALLHRAHASLLGSHDSAIAVFFEVLPLCDPATTLAHMLAPMWGCRPVDVEIASVCSVDYALRHWTRGSAATGDARLFECGFGADGRIEYLLPERTLLLVTPPQLQRLVQAQRAAQQLADAGYAEPAADRHATSPRTKGRFERLVAAARSVA
ncbi:MAG TPA: hypothetical protein PLF63_04825 [Rubrivivax sp.]|jgi:hypothetical protein|nr:hypothetical protein [Rubrivivax sp.]